MRDNEISMMRKGRGLWLAAFGSAILSGPALAQNASAPASDVIGPPALENFELRPENQASPFEEPRPTIAPVAPPAPTGREPEPATSEPVVTITAPPAPVQSRPAPQPRQSVAQERETQSAPPPSADSPAPDETLSAPMAEPVAPPPLEQAPAPAPTIADPVEQPALEPDGSDSNLWLYLLFAGLVAGLGFFLLRRRSQPVPALAAPVASPPLRPAVPTPPAPRPETPTRPWIDLEFKPSEAGSTDSHAMVKFDLMVRNTGDGEARDVRIDGRLFNAGSAQDGEIGAFFAEAGNAGMPAPRPIAAKTQLPYRGTVLLPREQIQEVTVQGRRLFIPMVAFNVRYCWGEAGTGQTSATYLVGSESDPPAEKMGAFRLDLGPRIYRKVGQREHRLRRRI